MDAEHGKRRGNKKLYESREVVKITLIAKEPLSKRDENHMTYNLNTIPTLVPSIAVRSCFIAHARLPIFLLIASEPSFPFWEKKTRT